MLEIQPCVWLYFTDEDVYNSLAGGPHADFKKFRIFPFGKATIPGFSKPTFAIIIKKFFYKHEH